MESKNTSLVQLELTASTQSIIAEQRADKLKNFDVNAVIELCVGPSLKILEKEYQRHNIKVIGNDIDFRWKIFYPQGNWIIDNALNLDLSYYDAVVFAPPLSFGCTGKQKDYLSINEVYPSYYDFLKKDDLPEIVVLVLPGKTLSIKKDRSELYQLINFLYSNNFTNFEIKKMKDSKNKTTKYLEVYIYNN